MFVNSLGAGTSSQLTKQAFDYSVMNYHVKKVIEKVKLLEKGIRRPNGVKNLDEYLNKNSAFQQQILAMRGVVLIKLNVLNS